MALTVLGLLAVFTI